MLSNRFLNGVTVVTIALSILIVSTFALFIINAGDVMNSWKKGVRIMAYLKKGTPGEVIPQLEAKVRTIYGVKSIRFISKEQGLEMLMEHMRRQSSLLANLKDNPLPDAFEIRMNPASQNEKGIEVLSAKIEAIPAIEGVEYGQVWLGRFKTVYNLFRFAGFALGGLFFMASIFIVANTIRLVFYSRREEVDIMRLVGATDNFIKAPFYIEGLILGAFGGIIGLVLVFVIFLLLTSNVEYGFAPGLLNLRFLPLWMTGGILFSSMCVGWLGCFLSLKQFLKN